MLIKLSVVLAAFYFIYHKLTKNTQLSFPDFIDFLSKNQVFSIKNSSFLIVLSLFNWFFEIFKWKILVLPLKKINFITATQQSLASLTASLFTPNRIGEYGAKAMYYHANLRKQIMGVNLLSNTLQMAVTCILGSIGFVFFTVQHQINTNYHKLAVAFTFLCCSILIVIYILKHKKLKNKWFSFNKLKQALSNYPKSNLSSGLLLSLIRYAIFSFQLYILLHFFGVNISYFTAMPAITTMYLVASIIPSIFIFDVVVKGSIAVYIFAFLQVNHIIVLSVVTLMWLLNFVLPSIVGSYYVISYKLPKQTVNT
ncbi:lysylphosphatidylglycerol synthase domain-containing protein [Postechiella marina]|uniref:Lysylphosphatidylglycerol synthase domain-containing protein n=1 Tax=Postechiella marina TaxID=943941 RepID=A0ABP8C374_9FLAO